MTTLYQPGDAVEGERLACICRKVVRKQVVVGSHAHRALEVVLQGTPARCAILRPVRALK